MKYLSNIILALPSLVGATPAFPSGWTASQPDGTSTGVIEVLMGTPSYHFTVLETDESYYVTIKDPDEGGYFKYAKIDESGKFVPSEHIVGRVDPEDIDIEPGLVESPEVIQEKCSQNAYCKWHSENNGMTHTRPPQGKMNNLVIPFRFADHTELNRPRPMNLDLLGRDQDLFNDDQLSVKDFFLKQSYGKLDLTSVFLPEVTITQSERDCAASQSGLTTRLHECLQEALDLSGADVDTYASVTFVHSGYGAEFGNQDSPENTYYDDRIWSHAWEMNMGGTNRRYAIISAFYSMANAHANHVGVAVHEIAQALGIPTMYGEGLGYGLGYYDVMANPWGFDGNAWHCGAMSAFTKTMLEWSDVEEINEEGLKEIQESTSSSKVYKISRGFPNAAEYLLIENRAGLEYDTGMRDHGRGLAIYHVDETANNWAGSPSDGVWPQNHYRVALIQADGRFDLEIGEDEGDVGDLFSFESLSTLSNFGPVSEGAVILKHDGYPNTKSYQGGMLRETGIVIHDISYAGEQMSFSVEFRDHRDNIDESV